MGWQEPADAWESHLHPLWRTGCPGIFLQTALPSHKVPLVGEAQLILSNCRCANSETQHHEASRIGGRRHRYLQQHSSGLLLELACFATAQQGFITDCINQQHDRIWYICHVNMPNSQERIEHRPQSRSVSDIKQCWNAEIWSADYHELVYILGIGFVSLK